MFSKRANVVCGLVCTWRWTREGRREEQGFLEMAERGVVGGKKRWRESGECHGGGRRVKVASTTLYIIGGGVLTKRGSV